MEKNKVIVYELESGDYDVVTTDNHIHKKRTPKKLVYLFSFVLGIILTSAFAPYNFLPAVVLSFSGYYFLTTQYINRKEALISGYLFGFGYYSSSLYWFANALTVQAEQFAWLIPFALTIIPSILALYFVMISWITFKFSEITIRRYLAFCSLVTISEYVRGIFIIPFPWNNFPYVLSNWDSLLQISYFSNQLTITFFLVFFSTLLYKISFKRIALLLIIFTCLHLFGVDRVNNSKEGTTDHIVRIVQPNFEAHHFGNKEIQSQHLSTLSNLSSGENQFNLKAILWPESAFPYVVGYGSYKIKILSALAPKNGYLITGADTYSENGKFHNSIIAVDDNWMIAKRHDKKFLVPFGEYIPFRNFLPFIDKIAYGMGDFSKGNYINNYDEADDFLHFLGLVCYEIIFPISDNDAQNAKWILNVSNDAWFGNSIGPHQHLAMAKYKAAEYGIPVIRVTNNGISSIFSPYGLFLQKTDFNQQMVVDCKIPTRIALNQFFLKKSSILLWILLLIVCIYREKSLKIWWEK